MLTDLLCYDLKVAALLAVFYLFYRLLLARETTHLLNRVVLLASLALSLVLPLCVITFHRTEVIATSMQPVTAAPADGHAMAQPMLETLTQEFDWSVPLAVILAAGAVVRLLFLLQGYRKLNMTIRGGEKHTLPSGIRVCVVDKEVVPFTWMKTVVLSRADWQSQPAAILAHEEAHVRHRHSYDVVVVEVLTALQWFNPVVWFMRQELRTLHEYEADASVLSRGFDESQYIHLLMQKAMGIQACALACGIHSPKTKKRIFMMLKTKSKQSAWLKALYILPVALVSLAMSAETVTEYEIVATNDNPAVRLFNERTNGRGESYQIRHQPGVKFFRNGVEEQISDGRSIALEVSKTTMQVNGKPVDQLTLLDLPLGALKEVHLTEKGSDRYVCNLLTESPSRKTVYIVNGEQVSEDAAGKIRQEDVVSLTTVVGKENVKNTIHVADDEAVIVETDTIFSICEQLPRYPGGETALMQFLARNTKYPEVATNYGVQGRVQVKFVVEKDGRLTNVETVETKGTATMVAVTATMTDKERQDAEAHNAGVKALRDEAIRVVSAMPRWTPGRQRGKPVRCFFTLPVTYRLN